MYGYVVRNKIITTELIEYEKSSILRRERQYLTLIYGKSEGEFKVTVEILEDGAVVVPVAVVKMLIVTHFNEKMG